MIELYFTNAPYGKLAVFNVSALVAVRAAKPDEEINGTRSVFILNDGTSTGAFIESTDTVEDFIAKIQTRRPDQWQAPGQGPGQS